MSKANETAASPRRRSPISSIRKWQAEPFAAPVGVSTTPDPIDRDASLCAFAHQLAQSGSPNSVSMSEMPTSQQLDRFALRLSSAQTSETALLGSGEKFKFLQFVVIGNIYTLVGEETADDSALSAFSQANQGS